MFTSTFWKSSLERAVKSFAQAFAAALGVTGVMFEDADIWRTALSTGAVAFVLSIMTSVGSAHVGPDQDPSLVRRPSRDDGDDAAGAAPPVPTVA